jgi:hypothetical protein
MSHASCQNGNCRCGGFYGDVPAGWEETCYHSVENDGTAILHTTMFIVVSRHCGAVGGSAVGSNQAIKQASGLRSECALQCGGRLIQACTLRATASVCPHTTLTGYTVSRSNQQSAIVCAYSITLRDADRCAAHRLGVYTHDARRHRSSLSTPSGVR